MELARQGSRSRSWRRRLAGPRKPEDLSHDDRAYFASREIAEKSGAGQSGRKVSSNRSSFNQSIDENRLSLQDSPSRVGDTKPSRAVDIRKGPSASRARRPLHLEGIAANERGIQVALDGPRLNGLAARLPCLAEREEISVRIVSGLFDEFAPSGG